MLQNEHYQELRDQWIPEHAYVCYEEWDEECGKVVMVYLNFEDQTCNILRFFPINDQWHVSADNIMQLRS